MFFWGGLNTLFIAFLKNIVNMSIRRIRINYIILIKDIILIKIIYNGINPHDLKKKFF